MIAFAQSPRWLTIAILTVAISFSGVADRASAVSPEGPEVKAVLAKAFKYLETAKDARLGGKCLIGLCFVKRGDNESHPQIKEAVTACLAAAINPDGPDVYSTGLAIVFLCELDASKYQAAINSFLKSLQKRQKAAGGWGYPSGEFMATGDTSMTQYGVLASWEAKRHGFVVPLESLENVCLWLLRTQDPTGGWGYQGKDAGPTDSGDIRLNKQINVRHGLSAAGLGSLFICSDLLALSSAARQDAADDDLPPALKPVLDEAAADKPLTEKIKPKMIRSAEDRGRGWWTKNYKIDVPDFPYYYLYALERYQSFAELAYGLKNREPGWYNDGFNYLKRKQLDDGSWASKADMVSPDTSFAILFLLRSTKRSIEKTKGFEAGILAGGQGLPRNLDRVRVRKGQIVAKPVTGSLPALLDVLAHPENASFNDFAGDPQDLVRQLAEEEGAQRAEHLKPVRQLAVHGPAETREVAVDVLAKVRDIENAPALIEALSDSQWSVVDSADEGLRSISRRVGAKLISDIPDEKARAAAIKEWRQWYASIHPEPSGTP